MTAKEFLRISAYNQEEIERLEQVTEDARGRVEIPPPSALRPATPRDIIEGAVIYLHPDTVDARRWLWHIIDEVHHPDDAFKAYTADDGCRYGLDGAYVEV